MARNIWGNKKVTKVDKFSKTIKYTSKRIKGRKRKT